ncbi:MAG TPA: threonine--tRNA ligase [Candidatus Acidoferrales bacterium]|nr:threonine--tRNA ligase [Candidatus Acidoferrales bacterium]
MRLLLLHCDSFEYSVRQEAIKQPEPLGDNRSGQYQNVLVVFCTVEKEDSANPDEVVRKVVDSISEVANSVKTNRILIYPYAHLSSSLASPAVAIPLLQQSEQSLKEMGFEVYRSPFGHYKSFSLHCLGHPLSELSRTIRPEQAKAEPAPIQTYYKVLGLDGQLYDPEEYPFKPGEEEFRTLVEKEALKKPLRGGAPKFLEYCKKFGIEWENFSDQGHMRYSPEGVMIFDLISEYSWDAVSAVGFPILQVKGTNMFDLSVPAVKEHADLFGSRLYRLEAENKSFVLRYAACHQQFAAVRNWALSYRHLPFGTFEVADSYRLEQSGELLLAFRLRKLHMPDCHVYCKNLEDAMEVSLKLHDRIYVEIGKLGRDYVSVYNITKSFLDANKEYVMKLVKREGKPALLNFVPEGIYYWVLNIEYHIIDELERPREIATFQIDMGNAKRFGIAYVNEKGEKELPPIIHTAVIGSVERYLFTILDECARRETNKQKPSLPLWLSPTQVRIIPLKPEFESFAEDVAAKISSLKVRADIDDRDESVDKRVREAELNWIPYIAVLGKREQQSKLIAIRRRIDGKQYNSSLEDLAKEIAQNTIGYPSMQLKLPTLLTKRPGYKQIV